MVRRWRGAATGLLVVLVLLGGAFGVARWLFRDLFGDIDPTSADVARTEALGEDPVLAYVPEGWVVRFGPVPKTALADFPGDTYVSVLFDIVEPSDNVAVDMLEIVRVAEGFGWAGAYTDCARLRLDPPVSARFTAIKVIDGDEARLSVSIDVVSVPLPSGDGTEREPTGRIEVVSYLVGSEFRFSDGRPAGDILCLEAAAG